MSSVVVPKREADLAAGLRAIAKASPQLGGGASTSWQTNASAMHGFAQELQRVFGATACVISLAEQASRRVALPGASGTGAAWQARFEEHKGYDIGWLLQAAPGRRAGDWAISDGALASFRGSRLYRSWMQPQGLEHGLFAGFALEHDDDALIAIFRSAADGPFAPEEQSRLGLMMPSVRQVLAFWRSVRVLQSERDALVGALDCLAFGVVLLDFSGKVVTMNRSAAEIAQRSRTLAIKEWGIQAANREENERLRAAIHRATVGRLTPNAVAEIIPIAKSPATTPLSIGVLPLNVAMSFDRPNAVAAAVIIADPDAVSEMIEEPLLALYGLTRVEARLAMRIAQGDELKDVAMELRISIHTARKYLKQIFAKMSVGRQSEMVRVLMAGASQIRLS
jgi:DNA-binding CsgD family transcriptional regulator/PAS domain-containing protein